MDEINIYTYQSIKSLKADKGAYVYILETIKKGEPKTLTGERKLIKPTTQNAAELITLTSALNRITKKCKINVYTDSDHIIKAINQGWIERWEADKWINSRGNEIANKDEWQKLLLALRNNDITFVNSIEPHSYYNWMMQEAEKIVNDKENNGEEKTIPESKADSPQLNKHEGHTSDSKGAAENPKEERIRHQIKATKLINIFRSLDKPLKDYSTMELFELEKCAKDLAVELNLYQEYTRKEKR